MLERSILSIDRCIRWLSDKHSAFCFWFWKLFGKSYWDRSVGFVEHLFNFWNSIIYAWRHQWSPPHDERHGFIDRYVAKCNWLWRTLIKELAKKARIIVATSYPDYSWYDYREWKYDSCCSSSVSQQRVEKVLTPDQIKSMQTPWWHTPFLFRPPLILRISWWVQRRMGRAPKP